MSDIAKTIFGISFIFLMTSLGAGLVFLFKKNLSEKANKIIIGFSSGIMLAASIWSLLLPAIEQSSGYGKLNFLPALLGFGLGGLFIAFIDYLSKIIGKTSKNGQFGMKKHTKLLFAMTIHNIPEGLAVGVAFGGAFAALSSSGMALALSLAVGIGLQNIPEGMAVALPLQAATGSKWKGFLMGVASGSVEPIAAVIGFFLASAVSVIMPWALSFAAGAMIFVVVSELLPELSVGESTSLGVWATMLGFMLMMTLDVAL